MIAKVVLEDMGVGENGAKCRTTWKYSPTCPRAKLWSKNLWIGGSCGGKMIKFKLVDKT
jgi:hypothetical protein